MTNERTATWRLERLSPFGLTVNSEQASADLAGVTTSVLEGWIAEHRIVVLRGFAPLVGEALPEFCHNLGELLEWEFGVVNELRIKNDTRNYLYTNRAVPFHWDGAFIERGPHYIFFHCDVAPAFGSGGETLFCDTMRLLDLAPIELQKLWERTAITYTTEKIVHYGGSFTSPMVTNNPTTGERVLRYAEPVADLNPVRLDLKSIAADDRQAFIEDMHRRLNDDRCCYRHQWLNGDVVIADNQTLLHGRRAFEHDTKRQIRRVNIL